MQRAHLSLWRNKKHGYVFLLLFPLVFFLTLIALQGDSLPHGYVQEYWGDRQSCCLALHFEKNFFLSDTKAENNCTSASQSEKNVLEHGEKFLSCGASGLLTFTVFWTHATTHFCSLLLALFEQQVAAAPLVWGFRREWIHLGEPPCFVSWTGVSFCWEARGLALLVCAGSAGGRCWAVTGLAVLGNAEQLWAVPE